MWQSQCDSWIRAAIRIWAWHRITENDCELSSILLFPHTWFDCVQSTFALSSLGSNGRQHSKRWRTKEYLILNEHSCNRTCMCVCARTWNKAAIASFRCTQNMTIWTSERVQLWFHQPTSVMREARTHTISNIRTSCVFFLSAMISTKLYELL